MARRRDEDLDDDLDDDLDEAHALTTLPSGEAHGRSSLVGRASRVARQKLPSLPSRGDVAEGALVAVGIGIGAMVAWHYLSWLLWIPLFFLKAAALGAGVWGAWWLYSKIAGEGSGSEDFEDEEED